MDDVGPVVDILCGCCGLVGHNPVVLGLVGHNRRGGVGLWTSI